MTCVDDYGTKHNNNVELLSNLDSHTENCVGQVNINQEAIDSKLQVHYSLNQENKIFAIGDIHGDLGLLITLLFGLTHCIVPTDDLIEQILPENTLRKEDPNYSVNIFNAFVNSDKFNIPYLYDRYIRANTNLVYQRESTEIISKQVSDVDMYLFGFKWNTLMSNTYIVFCGDLLDRTRDNNNDKSEIYDESYLILMFINTLHHKALLYNSKIIKICGNHDLARIVYKINQSPYYKKYVSSREKECSFIEHDTTNVCKITNCKTRNLLITVTYKIKDVNATLKGKINILKLDESTNKLEGVINILNIKGRFGKIINTHNKLADIKLTNFILTDERIESTDGTIKIDETSYDVNKVTIIKTENYYHKSEDIKGMLRQYFSGEGLKLCAVIGNIIFSHAGIYVNNELIDSIPKVTIKKKIDSNEFVLCIKQKSKITQFYPSELINNMFIELIINEDTFDHDIFHLFAFNRYLYGVDRKLSPDDQRRIRKETETWLNDNDCFIVTGHTTYTDVKIDRGVGTNNTSLTSENNIYNTVNYTDGNENRILMTDYMMSRAFKSSWVTFAENKAGQRVIYISYDNALQKWNNQLRLFNDLTLSKLIETNKILDINSDAFILFSKYCHTRVWDPKPVSIFSESGASNIPVDASDIPVDASDIFADVSDIFVAPDIRVY